MNRSYAVLGVILFASLNFIFVLNISDVAASSPTTIVSGGGGAIGTTRQLSLLAVLGIPIYTFGRFDPPVPFSATDNTKIDAPIVQTSDVSLDYYPVNNEMVKMRLDWSGNTIPQNTGLSIKWYNDDDQTLLFSYTTTLSAGWQWFWVTSWIGHASWEINAPGNYDVKIFADGIVDKTIFFRVNGCPGTDTSCGIYPSCASCSANNGFVGNNFCFDNDVYRAYRSYSCSSNSCSFYSDSSLKVTECGTLGCNPATNSCSSGTVTGDLTLTYIGIVAGLSIIGIIVAVTILL